MIAVAAVATLSTASDSRSDQPRMSEGSSATWSRRCRRSAAVVTAT
jgi:hypothetical protein